MATLVATNTATAATATTAATVPGTYMGTQLESDGEHDDPAERRQLLCPGTPLGFDLAGLVGGQQRMVCHSLSNVNRRCLPIAIVRHAVGMICEQGWRIPGGRRRENGEKGGKGGSEETIS